MHKMSFKDAARSEGEDNNRNTARLYRLRKPRHGVGQSAAALMMASCGFRTHPKKAIKHLDDFNPLPQG